MQKILPVTAGSDVNPHLTKLVYYFTLSWELDSTDIADGFFFATAIAAL